MSQQLRSNGRFTTQKKMNNNLRYNKNLEKCRLIKLSGCEKKKKQNIKEITIAKKICEGRRIIDIGVLLKNLICFNCKKTLNLENIVSERLIGLHAVWGVNCNDCEIVTNVHSGKKHLSKNNDIMADINTRTVLGVLHSGTGLSSLNKLLACINIPTLNDHLYKKYEKEVGLALEEAAKESCIKAAEEERQLTIDGVEKLCVQLPPEILNQLYPELDTLYSCDADDTEKLSPQKVKAFDAAVGNIVHIIVSYDMGWSKRGNGKSYDSLNGYGTIIGFLSKKILDYATRNRQCKSCDKGDDPNNHLCRKNYTGSAKAMEPDAGAELVNNSQVLKAVGLDVRAVIGDDDSSTIASILKGSVHKIFKLSCRVHLSRNFASGLYALKKNHGQLARPGVIKHLKKCFSYALAQNVGNAARMKDAILAIRDHVYDQHENCGSWCRRDGSKKPTVILTDPDLHSSLFSHLLKYANNSEKFTVDGTSQANENFNAIVAHKMPKSHCYSLSASADFRVAGAVLTKNEGDNQLVIMEKKLLLSPGKYTKKFANTQDAIRQKKSAKIKTKETKLQRILLAKKRENLRKKNENKEGVQYQRNSGIELGEINYIPGHVPDVVDIDSLEFTRPCETCQVVFFDIETSGFAKTADILQIAAKCNDKSFTVYINPVQMIEEKASEITGLRNIGGQLILNNKKINSIPLKDALLAFCQFLNDTPTVIVAHNAPFDVPRLFRAIQACSLLKNFYFISGYVDTLSILKQKMPKRKGKSMFKLSTLAKDFLQIELNGNFHEALYDVEILEKITSLKITKSDMLKQSKCFFEPLIYQTLKPLEGVVSNMIIKRISNHGITFKILKEEYICKGRNGIVQLFAHDIGDNTPKVTKGKKITDKIINVLQDHHEIPKTIKD